MWVANLIYWSMLPKQRQIKPKTFLSYLSALKSYHINKRQRLKGFDDPRIAFIIKEGRRPFPSKKQNRLPITKNIFEMMAEKEDPTVTDFNIDTTLKMAWANLIRIEESIYTSAEAKKATFSKTGLIRSNISFAGGDQYVILRLKRSKTNTEHTGVQIILAATNNRTCFITSLRKQCTKNPRLPNALLFRL